MPLPIYRLRRWLAVIAVLFTAVVAGMYLYARLRQHSVLKGFPGKISYDIKQTASGFQFSKSEAGRTVFTIRAKDVKEFKLNGRADLHDVSIVLYGRDTSRFDQIYGDDFTFDPKSGNVTARGQVQIDLEANPAGNAAPDQATPKELKNPIHLETTDLVFNRDSGDASTEARVDFRTPQATGWAVGVHYSAKSATLTLASQVHVTVNGEDAANLFAARAVITRAPRVVMLDHPRMERESGTLQSDEATFFLGAENEVQRILATGNVNAESRGQEEAGSHLKEVAEPQGLKPSSSSTLNGTTERRALPDPVFERAKHRTRSRNKKDDNNEPMRARSDQADLLLTGKQNLLRTAILTGNVHVERGGDQPMQGDAGRVLLDFLGRNVLQKAHASEGVRLAQRGAATGGDSAAQNFDVTALGMDFFVANGRELDRAQTEGAAKITIFPAQNSKSTAAPPQRTVITAGRFDAKFAATSVGNSRLSSVHGAPNAKIVNVAEGVPDRVSTSQTLDAAFWPEGATSSGISSIIQQGSVVYSDGLPPEKRTQAWADKALYTPEDRILLLTGNPRVTDGGMTTTATNIRINRATGEAHAEGDVKTTYSELKEQPDGALLASSSPIHVTAANMKAHNSPAIAVYEGNARIWQDANMITAPTIQFDRAHRSLVAQGSAGQEVSTVLVKGKQDASQPPSGKAGENSPIAIRALRLIYVDADRKAHYDGGVTAKGPGFAASSREMDVYLQPRSQTSDNQSVSGLGRLDHMVAQGSVVITQPGRHANGKTLVYTASDDKFILTGGPPSIFDAEHGKITGDSLTFFRGDDRVLVEGEASTPVVTQTQVAR
jgi:lipopolysaccharide export system protein LptA